MSDIPDEFEEIHSMERKKIIKEDWKCQEKGGGNCFCENTSGKEHPCKWNPIEH